MHFKISGRPTKQRRGDFVFSIWEYKLNLFLRAKKFSLWFSLGFGNTEAKNGDKLGTNAVITDW